MRKVGVGVYYADMVFSFFTKDEQEESLALLIDVGSASVGAALVRIGASQAPHILSTNREVIPFQETLSSERFLLAMNHALERVLKTTQAGLKGHGSPKHIFCTLSSPWFILKSRNIHVARTENFKVTEEVLSKFLDDDIELLKEELKDTLPVKDTVIIEKKIIQMKLNGYEIKNPYGQTTTEMEMTATISLSSKKAIDSIKRKVGQFFHTESLHFGSFPIVAFNTIRDIFPEEKNFIFIDVTGEATDVSLASNDIVTGTVSFPRGKNFFIREVSSHFWTIHEEASTLFSMYLNGTLDGKRRTTVESIVLRSRTEWTTRFEKALTVLAKNGVIPRTVFFTSDNDVSRLFTGLINGAKSDYLMSNSFEARQLDELLVAKFVSFESEVLRDPFLVVEALLVSKLIKTGFSQK